MKKNYDRKSKKIKFLFLTLLLSLLFILFYEYLAFHFLNLCGLSSGNEKPAIVIEDKVSQSYEEVLRKTFPEMNIYRVPKEEVLCYLDSKCAPVIEMTEFQALPMLEVGNLKSWTPHYVSTIIIAVDRDRISEEILGWRDLLQGDYLVYIDSFEEGVSAMATGLDEAFRCGTTWPGYELEHRQTDYMSMDGTMNLLKELYDKKRLVFQRKPKEEIFDVASVTVMEDIRARELKSQGKNIEIIVPKEGTLSIRRGLGIQQNLKRAPEIEKIEQYIEAGRVKIMPIMMQHGIKAVNNNFFSKYAFPQNEENKRSYFIQDIPSYDQSYLKIWDRYVKEVKKPRKYSDLSGMGIAIDYMIVLIIIVLWTGLIQIRIVETAVRRCMLWISSLLVFWLILRIIKYLVLTEASSRFLWYAYYIPFIGILTFWFLMCGEIAQVKKVRNYKYWIMGISVVFIILVLTNASHQLVFRFHQEWMQPNGSYSYGFIYHLLSFWMFLMALGGGGLLFVNYRKKMDRKRIWAPIAVIVVIILYHLFYLLRVPYIYNSEMTMSYVFIICMFIESMLYAGMIQSNSFYKTFFQNNSQSIYLLSNEKNALLKTDIAPDLPKEIKFIDLRKISDINKLLSKKEGHTYNLSILHGGYALWEEDVSPVLELKTKLQDNAQELLEKNKIILDEYMARKKLYQIKIRKQLIDQIEDAISNKIDTISSLVDTLYEGSSDIEKNVIRKKITYIKMMVSYCKRMSNLVMLSQQSETLSMGELIRALRETLQDSEVAGIEYGLVLREEGKVFVEDALFVYDYIYTMIEKMMNYNKPVAFIHLSANNKKVRAKLVFSAEGEKLKPEKFLPQDDLRISMIVRGYTQTMEIENNSLEIYLLSEI